MGWILDVIILLILGITVFIAYKKGFLKTVLSAGSFLIAIAVTALLAQPFAAFLRETSVAESLKDKTEQKIISIIDENSYDVDDLLDGKSEEFNRIVKIAGINEEDLSEWKEEQKAAKDKAVANLAEKISSPIVNTASSVISVIVLFIATQAALLVAKHFVEKLNDLPVLRTCDKVLGIILGVILGIFRVLLFCFAAHVVIEIGEFVGNEFLSSFDINKTLLFGLISKIKIFAFFL